MTELEVLRQISEQLYQLEQLQQHLNVLQDIFSQMVLFYQGIVLFLGVMSGILLGLLFWLMLKE